MTKCDGCGEEVGKLYCGHCRQKIEKSIPSIGKLIPLLFFDAEKKQYLIGCTVIGCPCNKNGICATRHLFLPMNLLHEFDGDNIIQQNCG